MTVTGGGGNGGQPAKVEPADPQMESRALSQMKDLLGVNFNEELGRQALRSARTTTGNYDIQYAVNWLLDQNVSSGGNQRPTGFASLSRGNQQPAAPKFQNFPSGTEAPQSQGTAVAGAKDNRQKAFGPSEDTELQKAIALSLQQTPQQQQTPLGLGGQISAEEQELSKVIEASIAESKKGSASHDLRQSSLFFVDPPNPHERERNGCWPVGLKNVGNTCWFSVVVQALFHLPVFRWRLLHYDLEVAMQRHQPVEAAASSSASSSSWAPSRELEFSSELRKLFALLLASRRKYVDPSGAVDVLRKQDSLQLRNVGSLDSGQQDVSEFTHLLLEWLEEAFKSPSARGLDTVSKAPMQDPQNDKSPQRMELDESALAQDNPIDQLFYGTVIKENRLPIMTEGGNQAAGEADAGVDVQVVPAMKEERFSQYPLQVLGCETLHDSMEKSLRPEDGSDVENWLERLPPVFLFELTRFQYNQVDKKPEKIHSKFRFPKVLYVDRYLRKNKATIREKRGHVNRLRQRLNTLKYELEKLENYRGSKMALADVLGLTLDFVSLGDDTRSVTRESEPMDCCESRTEEEPHQSFLRRLTGASGPDLETINRCVGDWRAQVQAHVEDLKAQIRQGEEQIEQVYLVQEFQQHPYMLHAVLVHEGQATLGHYWAFIHDRKTDKWLKFNDVQVTEVSYEEVERDSVGGYQSTSAYCLVYVDVRRSDIFEGVENTNEMEACVSLPPDLQQYITDDNNRFIGELRDWECKHPPATATAATPTAPTAAPVNHPPQGELTEANVSAIVEDVNRLFGRRLQAYVQERLKAHSAYSASPEDVFSQLVEERSQLIRGESEELLLKVGYDGSVPPKWHACFDQRIQSLPFYAYCWIRVSNEKVQSPYNEPAVLRRTILDFFANNALVGQSTTEAMTTIYQMAKRSLSSMTEWSEREQRIYGRICRDFKMYMETMVLLAFAVSNLHKGDYVRALQGIICTKNYAERLSLMSENAGGVDFELVLSCYRVIVMHLSEQTIKEVLSTNDDQEAVGKVKSARSQLLQCLTELLHWHNDSGTLETVRAGWFAAVVDEKNTLSDVKQRELRDFLDALMEVETVKHDTVNRQSMNAKITLQADVGSRFAAALRYCREFGILQCPHGVNENVQSTIVPPSASN